MYDALYAFCLRKTTASRPVALRLIGHIELPAHVARGVIDVRAVRRLETVPTEPGAHMTALDARRRGLYVLLPETHRAAVFVDE